LKSKLVPQILNKKAKFGNMETLLIESKKSTKRLNDNQLVRKKLNDASARGYFKTVDLFAGCGGMSLGFDKAGFSSVAAIEIDDNARASHELNFGR
jgi:predicted RNA methylase